MSPRKVTDEERDLFKEVFSEARPLIAPPKHLDEVRALVTQKRKKSTEEILPGGVDGRTEERLRKGQLEPDARLDLHGYTETRAHDVLLNFLRVANQRGHRMIIVVTGKGAPKNPDAPFDLELDRKARGILKTVVPRWLAEPAFARFVTAVRQAHHRHGGEGALYVFAQVKQKSGTLKLSPGGAGLHDFTDKAQRFVSESGIVEGLFTCFIRHTSASLVIQENADPDVLRDLEDYFAKLVPKSRDYRHDAEGPDDMPSHIKSALTATTLSIPVRSGELALGTWQALYLFEHRDAPHTREVLLHVVGE